MATLANFYGVLIGMKPEKNGRHHRPHIHAWYQGKEATFDIATREILAGGNTFPADQSNMVKAFSQYMRRNFSQTGNLSTGQTASTFRSRTDGVRHAGVQAHSN